MTKLNLFHITKNYNEKSYTIWFSRNKNCRKSWYGKSITISYYHNEWKNQDIKPRISFQTNKASRKNPYHHCFDTSLTIGYLVINYTNWQLQKPLDKPETLDYIS